MSLHLNVHTSWEYDGRSIMICGFKNPTPLFTEILDAVMLNVTAPFATILNR